MIPRRSGGSSLAGRRLLIVEDDWLIASETTRLVQQAGGDVLGPAGSVDTALTLINGRVAIDGALVDINLRGEASFAVADLLAERGIPFCFVTGYGQEVAPERFRNACFCSKPLDVDRAARAMFEQ